MAAHTAAGLAGHTTMALPPVIGHRGAAKRAPENTLAGFRCAKALGCDWVEFDVQLTADGGLVLCHDDRLDRTTDAKGRVSDKTLREVRQADAGIRFDQCFAGERVPSLEEALVLCAELGLGANIEIKAERKLAVATAAAVCAGLSRYAAESPPLLVSSFVIEALAAMGDIAPEVPRGLLLKLLSRGWAGLAARLECATVNLDHRRLRPGLVAAIRAAGFTVLAYTVNDPARAKLLFDWGVTSVFSDVPDIILAMITGQEPVRSVIPDGPAIAPALGAVQ